MLEDDDVSCHERCLLGGHINGAIIGIELLELADGDAGLCLEHLEDDLTSVTLTLVGVRINDEYVHWEYILSCLGPVPGLTYIEVTAGEELSSPLEQKKRSAPTAKVETLHLDLYCRGGPTS